MVNRTPRTGRDTALQAWQADVVTISDTAQCSFTPETRGPDTHEELQRRIRVEDAVGRGPASLRV